MNPRNGWDSVRDAERGIHLWKKLFLRRKLPQREETADWEAPEEQNR